MPSIWVDTIIQLDVPANTNGKIAELLFVPDRFERNDLFLVRTLVCLDFYHHLDEPISI